MKIFSILIALIIVIALIAVGWWAVTKYLSGSSPADDAKLVELCNIWKNDYGCSAEGYAGELAALCDKRYPEQEKDDDDIIKHCKNMCTVGDCNPYYVIGGDE